MGDGRPELPWPWLWEGALAVYESAHLRTAVTIDEDDDFVVDEVWFASAEAGEETRRYIPVEVVRAVLELRDRSRGGGHG